MKVLIRRCAYGVTACIVMCSLAGCGETFHGIGKDVRRMGKGVKTIFVRDSE